MITVSSRGSGFHNTSSASWTLNVTSNCTDGALVVLSIAIDNAHTNGTNFSSFTVTDSIGNTWVARASPLYDPGTANSGVCGRIFETKQNVGPLQTGTTITVTTNVAATAKCWTATEIAFNGTLVHTAASANAGAATATPTLNSPALTPGDVFVGVGFAESGNTWIADSDFTGGTYTNTQSNAAGTGATGMSIISQVKVITSAATLTFNPTLTSADCILAYGVWRETVDPGWVGGGWW